MYKYESLCLKYKRTTMSATASEEKMPPQKYLCISGPERTGVDYGYVSG